MQNKKLSGQMPIVPRVKNHVVGSWKQKETHKVETIKHTAHPAEPSLNCQSEEPRSE